MTTGDAGEAYVSMYAEFMAMGVEAAARQVLLDGLKASPMNPKLLLFAVQQGLDVPEHLGPEYAQNYLEFAAMGLPDAAGEVLRQGMLRYPKSPLLLQLNEAEEKLRKERRKNETLPPPVLPETPRTVLRTDPMMFEDEGEYPDTARAPKGVKSAAAGVLLGIVVSWIPYVPAYWFVGTFLLVHLAGATLLSGYSEERGLVAMCGVFGFHAGHAANELLCWLAKSLVGLYFSTNGYGEAAGSMGSWSIVVVFTSMLYMMSFMMECEVLPPDYLTSHSFFFPTYPAFNVAVLCSCIEFFVEWHYYPDWKIWMPPILLGLFLLTSGQLLMWTTFKAAERNFWASCRFPPPGEEEDFVGLEIPDRKILQNGPYSWERHPGFLGALLWGLGSQIALCNPVMLVLVGFVLWASLLHITLEEEKQMYEEFPYGYGQYSALVGTWIPSFNAFLRQAAFQRDMQAAAEKEADDSSDSEFNASDEEQESELEEEELEDDAQSEDGFLPTWDGVDKGGAIWNRQFRSSWKLG
eukprot:TRINITY_DN24380_c0_g1_i1.p1 TRINITY_DN24380_c0_g1~~TRINITY_DN24380_c0_g1_i1.p1  ORF type:complete len:522 (+),score=96.80 TRINITY_DN24380_c0_g1_i1:98-1663(+)